MPDDPGLELAERFATIGRDLLAADGVSETLDVVVHLATSTIKGCDHAAVSLITGRRITTQASTGDIPEKVDAIQLETDQGPCLDAIRTHEIYATDDLTREDRWPEFATRAARVTGVHSMLAFRLFAQKDTMGALNLFSDSVGAFDDNAEALGVVFAAHAAIALSAARTEEGLERSIETRGLIGEATGILVERRHIKPAEAIEALRDASHDRNLRLRDVAAEIVETGQDPEN
jgi:transcriptional regulator with GAF, ATPase, and Fis domain